MKGWHTDNAGKLTCRESYIIIRTLYGGSSGDWLVLTNRPHSRDCTLQLLVLALLHFILRSHLELQESIADTMVAVSICDPGLQETAA